VKDMGRRSRFNVIGNLAVKLPARDRHDPRHRSEPARRLQALGDTISAAMTGSKRNLDPNRERRGAGGARVRAATGRGDRGAPEVPREPCFGGCLLVAIPPTVWRSVRLPAVVSRVLLARSAPK
jgi:hypothetical protein